MHSTSTQATSRRRLCWREATLCLECLLRRRCLWQHQVHPSEPHHRAPRRVLQHLVVEMLLQLDRHRTDHLLASGCVELARVLSRVLGRVHVVHGAILNGLRHVQVLAHFREDGHRDLHESRHVLDEARVGHGARRHVDHDHMLRNHPRQGTNPPRAPDLGRAVCVHGRVLLRLWNSMMRDIIKDLIENGGRLRLGGLDGIQRAVLGAREVTPGDL
mmetsp:Transcript_15023/g.38996  ORF Transcript_15023/g.38996 Transcript_15023/m.38996 type:complete len:216 (+) Transcript_15023:100-747(+)